MTEYYSIRHNTAYNRGMPEIRTIVTGLVERGRCTTCGVDRRYPSGDLRVRLGMTRARMWPDVIACGDYPCFVVSDRFINAMVDYGIRVIPGGAVRFDEPIVDGLSLDNAPRYLWIDGIQHRAGTMDFAASGFVNVRFCSECGTRADDISLTYDRRHATPPPPLLFEHDVASGLDLFTTDLAPTAFFCTEKVLECARKHNLTNIGFFATARGVFAKPVDYRRPRARPRARTSGADPDRRPASD